MSSRLFAAGVSGPRLTDSERRLLSQSPPLGAILFRRNIESAEQLQALIAELRACGVALLFVDEEGGPVDRLRDLLAPLPSFRRAAAAGRAREAGALAGESLRTLGFDVDLAPVVDRAVPNAGAAVLGERAASGEPGEVIRAADAFLGGLHAAGVGGCLKHFPGLGRARLDTHESLPTIPPDPHQDALDLAPFDSLMEKARAVMVSHAAGPDGVPASLSYARATSQLRDVLDFDGAAFSDDLEMGALSAFGALPERAAAAARAGCDLLLVCGGLDSYAACLEAVERDVPAARRAEALERLAGYEAHVKELRRTRAALPAMDAAITRIAGRIREFGESLAQT